MPSAEKANWQAHWRRAALRGWHSVRMPVVLVREVLVGVGQRLMPMAMRVAGRMHLAGGMVIMVRVVFMLVLVLQRFMSVRVPMPLAEVQPNAQRHQHTGDEQGWSHRLAKQRDREHGAEERRH